MTSDELAVLAHAVGCSNRPSCECGMIEACAPKVAALLERLHTTHDLKTWRGPFDAILDGRKQFEVRRDERIYSVGDHVRLREWVLCGCVGGVDVMTDEVCAVCDGKGGGYTGRETSVIVSFVVRTSDAPREWGLLFLSQFVY